jgi:ribosomal protein S18 acetylase RimI-like enzyme
MRVRSARREEAATVAALGVRTYRDHYAALWREDELDAWLASEFDAGTIEHEIDTDRALYLVGDVEGSDVGFAKLVWNQPVPTRDERGAELRKIYFLADQAGRGYGRVLIEACAGQARDRGEGCLWLDVLKVNERARRMYERCGFAIVGERDYPRKSDPMPMWVMRHPLGATSDR